MSEFTRKLNGFNVSKASVLNDIGKNRAMDGNHEHAIELCQADHKWFVQMPPIEKYMETSLELRHQIAFETLKIGDIVDGIITSKRSFGLSIHILGLYSHRQMWLSDLKIYALCHSSEFECCSDLTTSSQRRLKQIDDYSIDDFVRGVIYKLNKAQNEIYISFHQDKLLQVYSSVILGVIEKSDVTIYTMKKMADKHADWDNDYSQHMIQQSAFSNPKSIATLCQLLRIDTSLYMILLDEKTSYPTEDYYDRLRSHQNRKWSTDILAIGIEHFKKGNNADAMKYIQQSLKIDEKNYEAMVAKGAIMANEGHFETAIVAFEEALELHPRHRNGLKYLCETLQTIANRSIQSKNYRGAIKHFEKILKYDPDKEPDIKKQLVLCHDKVREKARLQQESSKKAKLAAQQKNDPSTVDKLSKIKKLLAADDVSSSAQKPSKKKKKKKKKSKKKSKHKKHARNSSSSSSIDDHYSSDNGTNLTRESDAPLRLQASTKHRRLQYHQSSTESDDSDFSKTDRSSKRKR